MSASASAASSSAGSLFGVDPSVEQLAGSFDALGAHQFFSGNMKLAYNNVQGRYVVAAQDLPAGTLVLDQAPFAGVLFDDYVSVFCHQCFGKCMGTVYQCSDCKFARYANTQQILNIWLQCVYFCVFASFLLECLSFALKTLCFVPVRLLTHFTHHFLPVRSAFCLRSSPATARARATRRPSPCTSLSARRSRRCR